MSDWEDIAHRLSGGVIMPGDAECLGYLATSPGQSSVYVTANHALFLPFTNDTYRTFKKGWVVNGTAVSGNIDIGIYDELGVQLTAKGSTAQSGTSALQILDFADVTLAPGRYYMAFACDNTTATFMNSGVQARYLRMAGAREQLTAFPLPSPATFAACTAAYVPIFGITPETVI